MKQAFPFRSLVRIAAAAFAVAASTSCGGGSTYGGFGPSAPLPTGATPSPLPSGMTAMPATPSPAGMTPGPATPSPAGMTPGPATPSPAGMTPGPATPSPAGMTPGPATPSPAGMTPGPATPSPAGMTPSPATPSPTAAAATPTPMAATPTPSPTATPIAVSMNGTPILRHIFIIILENQAEDNTFGTLMPVPYLQNTVSGQGAFLPNYYGTSHNSLGNYISLFSGQSATVLNQEDCPTYTQIVQTSTGSYGQVGGQGCVYPSTVMTVADQLKMNGFTSKGYMEDMGNDTTREAATCGQTQPTATTGAYGTGDLTQTAQAANAAKPQDQYAMRHNPWPYFMSVVSSGDCAANVRPLNDTTLTADLKSVATTANYTFVTPNLCDDGHDVPCTAAGAAGTTASTYTNENAFLQKWVPLITRSPAFLQDGLLIVTFDESSPAKNTSVGTDTSYDGTSCCLEAMESDPNTTSPGAPPGGSYPSGSTGGGKTGTVLVSPFIKPGTVSMTTYNHYSTLHGIEDEFGLTYLGFAGFPGTTPFGTDVFGATPTRYAISL